MQVLLNSQSPSTAIAIKSRHSASKDTASFAPICWAMWVMHFERGVGPDRGKQDGTDKPNDVHRTFLELNAGVA
jgi:hypothetical protein